MAMYTTFILHSLRAPPWLGLAAETYRTAANAFPTTQQTTIGARQIGFTGKLSTGGNISWRTCAPHPIGRTGVCLYSQSITIGHTTIAIAYVILIVRARLAEFDTSLEEAALDLGAKPLTVFTKITLPIIMPSYH